MSKLKKFLNVAVGGILAANLISMLPVGAQEASQYGLGDNEMSESQVMEFSNQFSSEEPNYNDEFTNTSQLPSSVDLSTSAYFPDIGDQGSIGSCTAWATTYYQFTYEANKLNNIITTNGNTYSPSWTYNFTNCGVDKGSYIDNAYNVLKRQGALTLSEMPYNKNAYSFAWSTDTEAMTDALKTRVSVVDRITIPSTGTCITSNNDSDLIAAKALLNAGKVFVVRGYVDNYFSWSTKESYNRPDELVVYRASYTNSSHAMTVVGYDDNVFCDVNGNGVIEDCEKGAFKVANSWGTDWGNDGYIWVLYDALNAVSANKVNNWESNKSGERVSIFHRDDIDGNVFFYVNVQNYEIGMVGLLTINTTNKNKLSAMATRGDSEVNCLHDNITYFYNDNIRYYLNTAEAVPFNGTLVLDYTDLLTPINLCSYGFYYGVKINNHSSTSKDVFTNISYKIVDNLSNTICDFNVPSTLSSGGYKIECQKMQFQKGDVNYDGVITTDDIEYLTQYILQVNKLSNVQYYFADCNNDGHVDVTDIIVLRKDNNLY